MHVVYAGLEHFIPQGSSFIPRMVVLYAKGSEQ